MDVAQPELATQVQEQAADVVFRLQANHGAVEVVVDPEMIERTQMYRVRRRGWIVRKVVFPLRSSDSSNPMWR